MEYRDFVRPAFATRSHSVTDWVTWLEEHDVLIPTAPRPGNSCEMCGGAVKRRSEGDFWSRCFQCGGYSSVLDAFVPITYSTASGLESLLHRFKDWENREWIANPLGSLLNVFVSKHRHCLNRFSPVEAATFVPPNTPARTFSPLQRILDSVSDNVVKTWFPWDRTIISRDHTVTRPARAEIKPQAYTVRAAAVKGKTVLVLDDTWTSGSSLVSSAAALKSAGASTVIGLTLGRQLNTGGHYGSTDEILADVKERRWNENECVLCST